MINKDQGSIEVLTIIYNGIQNVLSPKHKGSVGGREWVGCVVSPLVDRVNLNEEVNMQRTWSLPDNNAEELTVLPAVLQ